MSTAIKTNQQLWKRIVSTVKNGDKGGRSGQWSARKAQLAVAIYKQRGGRYSGEKSPNNSLKIWSRQNWDYVDSKDRKRPRSQRGRYLPANVRKRLSSSEKSSTNRRKRSATRKGHQFAKYSKREAALVRAAGGSTNAAQQAAIAISIFKKLRSECRRNSRKNCSRRALSQRRSRSKSPQGKRRRLSKSPKRKRRSKGLSGGRKMATRPTSKGGGMSMSDIKRYKKMHPNSKLKTAVTEYPPRSKARAQRRKNFCSRSRSWSGPRGIAARKRWNC